MNVERNCTKLHRNLWTVLHSCWQYKQIETKIKTSV